MSALKRWVRGFPVYYWAVLPIFLTLFTLHSGTDYFFTQKIGVLLFLSLAIGYRAAGAYGPLVGGFFSYALCSAVYAALWRGNKFQFLGEGRAGIAASIFIGVFSSLGAFALASQVKRKTFEFLLTSFCVLLEIHAVIGQHFFHSEGFLMTQDLAALFVVLVAIQFFDLKRFILIVMPFLAVTHAYTAYLSILAACWGCLMADHPKHRQSLIFIPIALAGALYLIYPELHSVQKLADRLEIWESTYAWWKSQGYEATGMGSGTAWGLMQLIQTLDGSGQRIGTYVYLHNEPLQILFELGWVGLAWAAIIWLKSFLGCLKRNASRESAFLSALLVGSLAMPIRHDTLFLITAVGLNWVWRGNRLMLDLES